jgi:hypothetical protein
MLPGGTSPQPVEVEAVHSRSRTIRNVVTLSIGCLLLLSQVVIQYMGRSVSIELTLAGLSLLGVVPLFSIGDRRENGK